MAGSYPSVHFDGQNSGYIPDHVDGQRTRETFNTVWSFETGGTLRASPVVSDELVVVGDMKGAVYGLNAIDGSEHWRFDFDDLRIFAAPAISDGLVFVSGYDELNRSEVTTCALELTTGDTQWARDLGQGGRAPVATDGERVYVLTDDGTCHVLAAQTGETVWRLNGERYKKVPALSDGIVTVGDGEDIVALDIENGTERWRKTLNGHVPTPPVVDDGRIYVITRSDTQWCLDSATGQALWHTDIGEEIREHPETEDPLLPLGGSFLHSKPVTDGESLIASMYKGIVELDAVDGRVLDYHSLDQRVHDPLLVGGERERRLYGSLSNGGITEYQLTSDGIVQLRSTPWDALNTVPAYAAGVLYATTELDGIFAIT